MKIKTLSLLAPLSAVLLSLLAGCGDKEATVPATAPEAAAPADQEETAATVLETAAPVISDAQLAESQEALQSADFDRAAEALVAMQRAQLTEQQAAAAAAQMRQLQSSLAAALANGDPRAKAAADRLRQSSRAH